MQITERWLKCILTVILLLSSLVNAASKIQAVPGKVDLGTFNACLTKEAIVTLYNKSKDIFIIENIKADCGCINITTKSDRIPAKEKMDMIIDARQITAGKLSHDIVIIPQDKEHYEPLKVSVTGNVIEPVTIDVGWLGQSMKKYDPNNLIELDLIHKLSAKPVISIASNNKKLKFNKIAPDVNSPGFKLEKYITEKLSSNKEQNTEKLVLTLKPKDSLKIGILQENIKIMLTDDILLYIPIKSRIVGDAYVTEQRISFGTMADSANQEIEIHFANNTKPWNDIKWAVEGDLSGVIDFSINKSKCTDASIAADLTVNKSLLKNVPKGYNFSRLKFYQNDSQDDNTISLLIDGFN